MKYFKQISDGYIVCIGTGGGTEITEDEYNAILAVIRNKPAATETTDYRLREDLTWEEYPVDPPDPDPEIDDPGVFGWGKDWQQRGKANEYQNDNAKIGRRSAVSQH